MCANLSEEQCDELYSEFNRAEYERDEWQLYLDTELSSEHSLSDHEQLAFAQDSVEYWQERSVQAYDAWENGNCTST